MEMVLPPISSDCSSTHLLPWSSLKLQPKASVFQPPAGGRRRACFSHGALVLGKHWLSLSSPFLSRKLLGFLQYTPRRLHEYHWPQLIQDGNVISSISCLFNGCSLIVFLAVHGARMLSQTTDFQRGQRPKNTQYKVTGL